MLAVKRKAAGGRPYALVVWMYVGLIDTPSILHLCGQVEGKWEPGRKTMGDDYHTGRCILRGAGVPVKDGL